MSKSVNNTVIAGKISQIHSREKFVSAKILVDTGRKTRDNNPVINRIDVIGNGFVADRMRNLAEGDSVLAEGRAYSSDKEGKDTAYAVNLSSITKIDAGNFNHIVLAGRLASDLDERVTGNGDTVTNFRIAVDHNYKSGEEWVTRTSFFRVVRWGKVDPASKGSLVWVTGSLESRSYLGQDNVRHYLTEVNADSVIPGGSGRVGGNAGTPAPAQDTGFVDVDEEDEELPF